MAQAAAPLEQRMSGAWTGAVTARLCWRLVGLACVGRDPVSEPQMLN
jgi:hypothetical protein